MSCGIYKIENLKNGMIYIGQSVNIERRWAAHRCAAKQDKNNYPLYSDIRLYGEKNFSFEIVEFCEKEELDAREVYWIEKYNSYNNGYNNTLGGSDVQGEKNPRALLTRDMVYDIRQMYNNHIPFREVYQKYKDIISERGLQKVWHYETWLDICPEVYTEENKRWHSTNSKSMKQSSLSNEEKACSKIEIDKIKELYQNGYNYRQIAKFVNRSPSVVRKYCLNQESKYDKPSKTRCPIRNIETGILFPSQAAAAKWANCDRHVFSSHKNDSSFPIGTIPTTQKPAHWVWL